MDITNSEARDALSSIDEAANLTRRSLMGSAGPYFILWGIIAMLGYAITYALVLTKHYREIAWAWYGLAAVAWTIHGIMARRRPVRSPGDARIFWFWLILGVYSAIWLMLLWPWNGAQMNLFLITVVMFAYVIQGLFAWRPMLWLGLSMTVLTLAGYLYFQMNPLLWLYMAAVTGLPLIGTGAWLMNRGANHGNA